MLIGLLLGLYTQALYTRPLSGLYSFYEFTNIVGKAAGAAPDVSLLVTPVQCFESVIVRKVFYAVNDSCILFFCSSATFASWLFHVSIMHEQAHVTTTFQDPFGDCKVQQKTVLNTQKLGKHHRKKPATLESFKL